MLAVKTQEFICRGVGFTHELLERDWRAKSKSAQQIIWGPLKGQHEVPKLRFGRTGKPLHQSELTRGLSFAKLAENSTEIGSARQSAKISQSDPCHFSNANNLFSYEVARRGLRAGSSRAPVPDLPLPRWGAENALTVSDVALSYSPFSPSAAATTIAPVMIDKSSAASF